MIFLFSSIGFGQNTLPDMDENIIINDSLIAKPGEFYIDGIKVDMGKTFLHNENIKTIKKVKGESSKIFSGAIGATIIEREKQYEFVTLFKFATDIQNGIKNLKDEKLIEVFVNGILIENTSEYQIELNPEIKITIESYSNNGIYHGGKNNKPKPRILIETRK
jgi:hypothetical protein